MKVNTIALLPNYKNTTYNCFWDGYFHFSDRQWILLNAKGHELKAVEIRNPKAQSLNALKIVLLFTVIVPLIAAIYYLIKLCQFKGYQVTLIHPKAPKVFQESKAEIHEPKEEYATIQEPLNAENALKYLREQEVELNSDTKHLLSQLEEISFKQLKKWDLKNPQEIFTKLKCIKVLASEFTDENIPLIEAYKKAIPLELVEDSLDNTVSAIRYESIREAFPKIDLLPYILRFDLEHDYLLKAYLDLTQLDKIKESIQAIAEERPDLLKVIVERFAKFYTPYKNAFKHALVTYISSEEVFKDPEGAIQWILNEYWESAIKDLFTSLPDNDRFFENIKKLLRHKDTKPETRVKFIVRSYDKELEMAVRISFELLNNESFINEFQKITADPSFDPLFSHGVPPSDKIRSSRSYTLLLMYYGLNGNYAEVAPIDKNHLLLKARPRDFDLKKLNNIDFPYYFFHCLEILQYLNQDNPSDLSHLIKAHNFSNFHDILAAITPADQLVNLFKLSVKALRFLEESEILVFLSLIIKRRDDQAVHAILEDFLPNLGKYSANKTHLRNFIAAFNHQRQVDIALEIIMTLPQKKKGVLLQVFSGGIYNAVLLQTIQIPYELIQEPFRKRGLVPATSTTFRDLFEAFKE